MYENLKKLIKVAGRGEVFRAAQPEELRMDRPEPNFVMPDAPQKKPAPANSSFSKDTRATLPFTATTQQPAAQRQVWFPTGVSGAAGRQIPGTAGPPAQPTNVGEFTEQLAGQQYSDNAYDQMQRAQAARSRAAAQQRLQMAMGQPTFAPQEAPMGRQPPANYASMTRGEQAQWDRRARLMGRKDNVWGHLARHPAAQRPGHA